MAAMSAVVFGLSWWLGLYLLARDPRKPVLVLAAIGLTSFAVVVALDAVRLTSVPYAAVLSQIEIYLVVLPGVAWFAVLLELTRPGDNWRGRVGEIIAVAVVFGLAMGGAVLAGGVNGPLRLGHWLMFAVISLATLAAMARAVTGARRPGSVTGVAVALWDAFDEGQALRADMFRSFVGSVVVAVLFGGQALVGMAVTDEHTALTVLLFTSLAIAIGINVLADPLAGLLDRLAFSHSPALRADRAALRRTEAALPLRSNNPLAGVDEDTFVRLTRRALGHYGDLSKLVASPLTALPAIDDRLVRRGVPDQPLERANELKALLADRIAALKPRDAGDFGTTEQWRHYNSLYFPYVVGVRAYAQNATAAGLDPVARQAWQWFVTEVPQRSLHNWQNAAARVIAADLRGAPVPATH
jgi:hypothetical protein